MTTTPALRRVRSIRCRGRWLAAALAIGAAIGLGACAVAPAEPAPAAQVIAQGDDPGTRSTWFRPPHLVAALTSMDTLFPSHRVAAGGEVRPLPRHAAAPAWPFVDAYLEHHPATGLIVLKDGRLLVERYRQGRSAEQRFMSFSMAKTVVAMAFGIALAEGRIASVDDPVERYEPALAGSAWAGVPLRHVLQMSSGVRFDETYDRSDSDIAKLSRAWTQQRSLLQALGRFTERDGPSGARFHYVSADTQVLAQVLVKATGRPLADYVSEKLWVPMGAEADASWLVDGTGMEAGHCCFNARLRDWARLGQLLLDEGQRDGRAVLPRQWVQQATHVRTEDAHLQPRRATPYLGYGYQTWILPDGLGFALLGVRGQAVYVHPPTRTVMVQTAAWPTSTDAERARERDRFWRAVVAASGRL